MEFEEAYNNKFKKIRGECSTIFSSNEIARTIIDGVEEVICCYPTDSIFYKVEWVVFVLYNLLPTTHKYKDLYQTSMEIIRACESKGSARTNKRLTRLMKLNLGE